MDLYLFQVPTGPGLQRRQPQVLFLLQLPVLSQPDTKCQRSCNDGIQTVEKAQGQLSHKVDMIDGYMRREVQEQHAEKIVDRNGDGKKGEEGKEKRDISLFKHEQRIKDPKRYIHAHHANRQETPGAGKSKAEYIPGIQLLYAVRRKALQVEVDPV